MKTKDIYQTKGAIYAGMLGVFLTVVVATPFGIASTQSTRGDQAPSATSISPSQSTSAGQPFETPSYVADPNADKYKLIFAKGYEGNGSYRSDKPEDNAAFVQVTRSEFDNFVEHLNNAGAEGYKLVSATYGGFAVGIVRFDGVQYEYDWVVVRDLFALDGYRVVLERTP